MYPRALGQSIDCSLPENAIWPECGGGAVGSGPNWTSLISQGLTDVTQLISPGTPSPVRVYTPSSTATASVLSNPLFLIAGVAAVVLLMKRRR